VNPAPVLAAPPSALVGLAGIATVAAVLMAMILIADRSLGLHDEVLRKLVHLVTGTLSVSFPWIFTESWPVLLLAAITLLGMVALRVLPRWLHMVRRAGFDRTLRLESLGDITFPIAIAGLFLLARHQPVLYIVPLLIATFGDAAAAVVGKKFGRWTYQPPFGGTKTFEGSTAFFLVAFACFAVPLAMAAGGITGRDLAVGLGGAALTTVLEGVAWSGLDNLFLPFGAWVYLRLILA